MKAGDLIHMPGETVLEGETPSIGIVIDDVPRKRSSLSKSQGRIGIMWLSNWGNVDYEPKDWLEVLGEAQTLEA